MSKNKVKYLLFIISAISFSLFSSKVKALDYEINSVNISGLNYGDVVSDGRISGDATSSDGEEVQGFFSFLNPSMYLDEVGNTNIEVIFTPYDSYNYQAKKIDVEVDVSPRIISIVFDSLIYKQYDGENSINLPDYQYVGIIDNEVTIEGDLQASLAACYVGEGIGIVFSGVSVVGDKDNYYSLDLLNHTARIYPKYLEKSGINATHITLGEDIYVDTRYSLKVIEEEVNESINTKYTSFIQYSYEIYSHNNSIIDLEKSDFKVSMDIDEEIMTKERLTVFELTSEGEYKELSYRYSDGKIIFEMCSDSKIVFAKRNIEWKFIVLFSMVLLFSVTMLIVKRIKNSITTPDKQY